jgi:hypothetical protein
VSSACCIHSPPWQSVPVVTDEDTEFREIHVVTQWHSSGSAPGRHSNFHKKLPRWTEKRERERERERGGERKPSPECQAGLPGPLGLAPVRAPVTEPLVSQERHPCDAIRSPLGSVPELWRSVHLSSPQGWCWVRGWGLSGLWDPRWPLGSRAKPGTGRKVSWWRWPMARG